MIRDMSDVLLLISLSIATSGVGALGGLGGAVILVPALVLAGWSPVAAAPLGLISVAAGSVAAGAQQLSERSVNHRLGMTTELAATAGAVVGALMADRFSDDFLVNLLAAVALGAAFMGGRRKSLRNPPRPELGIEDVGERVGSLDGAYPVNGGVASYETRRLPLGLALMSVAGLVAGTTGAGGGFIKTPATSEIMHVPTKVAASTTTFTIGITASAALVVFALQGRVDVQHAAAVVFGSLAGGLIGAVVQSRLHPAHVRRALSVVLVVIAIFLVVAR
jgi:uncharacterized membrane protein YfcA